MALTIRLRPVPAESVADIDTSSPALAVRRELRYHLACASVDPWTSIEEFWVPRTYERADLAVVGSALKAFEIKSERDSLRRLPRQAQAFGRVFDYCTVVLAGRHLDAAMGLVPGWWGITEVTENGHRTFHEVRQPSLNHTVDATVIVRLLWREEALAALEAIETLRPVDLRVARSASRADLWNELLRICSIDDLRKLVRRALTRRISTGVRISPFSRRVASHATGR